MRDDRFLFLKSPNEKSFAQFLFSIRIFKTRIVKNLEESRVKIRCSHTIAFNCNRVSDDQAWERRSRMCE